MPRGFGAIESAAQRIKESGGGDFVPYLRFKLPGDGDSAIVRFLEQGEEVYSYWYHDFSHVDKQNGWKTKVPCLDQDDKGVPCPGCREDLPRKFEGLINVIWRNAPVFKKDDDDKLVKDKSGDYIVIDNKDQVAVWRGGIELFSKVLKRKDLTYKGLGTRDFEITREGLKLDTTYAVEPADVDAGASDLSDEDKTLAEDKYDLEEIANFKSEEDFNAIIEEQLEADQDGDDVEAFLNKNPIKEEATA